MFDRKLLFTLGGSVLLALAMMGTFLTAPAVAQTDVVKEEEVAVEGSTITITTEGANAVAVEDLPENVTITSVSDAGIYNKERRSILYTNLNDGLPDTVTFTMDPDDEVYTTDSTISFSVRDNSVTLAVVSQSDTGDDGSDNRDDSAEKDNQATEDNQEEAGSDTVKPTDDGETATEDDGDGTEVSVEETLDEVAETTPDTKTEIAIEDTEDESEGTTISIDETKTVKSVTFYDESVSGTVEINEYSEPPEDVATRVAESITHDIATNKDTQSDSDSAVEQGGNENEGDSTTTDPADSGSDERDDESAAGKDTSGDNVNVISMAEISPSSNSASESEATVTMTVDRDRVNSPSNAFITHETDGTWEQLETTVESQSDSELTLSAQTESFSLFAVVESDDSGQTDGSTESINESDSPNESFPISLILVGLVIVAIVSGVVFRIR